MRKIMVSPRSKKIFPAVFAAAFLLSLFVLTLRVQNTAKAAALPTWGELGVEARDLSGATIRFTSRIKRPWKLVSVPAGQEYLLTAGAKDVYEGIPFGQYTIQAGSIDPSLSADGKSYVLDSVKDANGVPLSVSSDGKVTQTLCATSPNACPSAASHDSAKDISYSGKIFGEIPKFFAKRISTANAASFQSGQTTACEGDLPPPECSTWVDPSFGGGGPVGPGGGGGGSFSDINFILVYKIAPALPAPSVAKAGTLSFSPAILKNGDVSNITLTSGAPNQPVDLWINYSEDGAAEKGYKKFATNWKQTDVNGEIRVARKLDCSKHFNIDDPNGSDISLSGHDVIQKVYLEYPGVIGSNGKPIKTSESSTEKDCRATIVPPPPPPPPPATGAGIHVRPIALDGTAYAGASWELIDMGNPRAPFPASALDYNVSPGNYFLRPSAVTDSATVLSGVQVSVNGQTISPPQFQSSGIGGLDGYPIIVNAGDNVAINLVYGSGLRSASQGLVVAPASQVAAPAQSVIYAISSPKAGVLSVSGLPPGVTASFNPAAIAAGGASSLTISLGPIVIPGDYYFQILQGGGLQSATAELTIFGSGLTAAPAGNIQPGDWKKLNLFPALTWNVSDVNGITKLGPLENGLSLISGLHVVPGAAALITDQGKFSSAQCDALNCTKTDRNKGNSSGPRWFDLTDPLNPSLDSAKSWDIDTQNNAYGDFGPGLTADNVAYAPSGSYSALRDSQFYAFVSDFSDKYGQPGAAFAGFLEDDRGAFAVSTPGSYRGVVSVSNLMENFSDNNSQNEKAAAKLPSGFPRMGWGPKLVLDAQTVASVEWAASDAYNQKPIVKIYNSKKTAAIASLNLPPSSLGAGAAGAQMKGLIAPEGVYIFLAGGAPPAAGASPYSSVPVIYVLKFDPQSNSLSLAVNGAKIDPGYLQAMSGMEINGKSALLVFEQTDSGYPNPPTVLPRAYLLNDLASGSAKNLFGNAPNMNDTVLSADSYLNGGNTYVYIATGSGSVRRGYVWRFGGGTTANPNTPAVQPPPVVNPGAGGPTGSCDFTLTSQPASQTISRDTHLVTYNLAASATQGSNCTISLITPAVWASGSKIIYRDSAEAAILNPGYQTTLLFNVAAPPGQYTINVTAIGGGITKTLTLALVVQ